MAGDLERLEKREVIGNERRRQASQSHATPSADRREAILKYSADCAACRNLREDQLHDGLHLLVGVFDRKLV